MLKKITKQISHVAAAIFAVAPVVVLAQSLDVPNPLGVKTVTELLGAIGGYFYGLAGAVASIMVLWGAFQILTAAGNSQKLTDGKNTVLYAAIGLAIVILAGGIKSLVTGILSGGQSSSSYSQPYAPLNPNAPRNPYVNPLPSDLTKP